jgi:hypothetical protein
VTRESAGELKQRHDFQMEAAALQRELSKIVRRFNIVLTAVRRQRHWSPANTKEHRVLICLAREQIARWLELAPPRELVSEWEDVLAVLEDLGPLLDESARIESATVHQLASMVAEEMHDFTVWLHKMTVVEGELLKKEIELSARARELGGQAQE